MKKPLPKIIVVVGPTASGKTSLAVQLAKRFKGEIISADSRLLYKGMNIGTAKPTLKERGGVPHHLIDVVRPDQTLTAAEYKDKALKTIRAILKKKRLPIVVGGTGLYVRLLVDNFEIPRIEPDMPYRRKLEKLPLPELLKKLKKLDPAYAERIGPNPRFAIRALEVMRATGKKVSELQTQGEPMFDVLQIGLKVSKDQLEQRIQLRIANMFKDGLLQETKQLCKKYDWDLPAMSGIGYRELKDVLSGKITLQEAQELIALHTRQYAKRQRTWFKRDPRIYWISKPNLALNLVKKWL